MGLVQSPEFKGEVVTTRRKAGPAPLALGASELRVLVAAGFTGPLLASALPPDVTPAGVARLFMVDDEAAMAKAAVLYGDSVRLAGPRVSIIRPISGRNRLPRALKSTRCWDDFDKHLAGGQFSRSS